MEFLAWLVVGIALGAVAAWLVVRAQKARTASEEAVDVERARTEVAQAVAGAAEARLEAAQAAAALADARAEVAGALAQRDAAITRAQEIAGDREQLVNQFKVLSTETVQAQERSLNDAAELRLKATEQLLDPVKESLQRFNERITDVEKQRVQLSTELRAQVSEVKLTGETLRRETAALVTALRKPQVRGAWGELQLKPEVLRIFNRMPALLIAIFLVRKCHCIKIRMNGTSRHLLFPYP